MLNNILKKHSVLLVLILANLIIGLLILPGFGESGDELTQTVYAENTIAAVKSVVATGVIPARFITDDTQQGSHGPAFIVTVTLLKSVFLAGGSAIDGLHFDHFLYFLVFLVGIVSIYVLARRWVSEIAAFGTALLFNTQPLLLGHAFMNPKDVVFMSLFSASIALGLWMVDRGGKTFQATGKPVWDGVRSFLKELLQGDVWLAGLALGFSSAVRVVAPLIGVVVLGYILLSRKWRLLPRVVAYGLIAICFMILFWPYLWPDALGRLLQSISISASFPNVHIVLFKGVLFNASDIPNSYVPVLLLVQLTETTLLLILVGAFALLKKVRWDFVALVVVWFVLPVAVMILAGVNLYNNLRQEFFIFPPLFLMAGLGLDWLLRLVRRPAIQCLVIFLCVLPGLYANVTLYPYQYIYYNQLVGGISGAYRNYELDYWGLAIKDAQDYVNQNAGKAANIYVDKTKHAAQIFARPDLVFNAFGGKNWKSYDFIVVSTAQNSDERFAAFQTVFVVERDGVPLAYVKKP